MKHKLLTINLLSIALLPVVLMGSSYFLQPTGAFVMPSDSGLSYHGMNGTVQYKDGYSVGLNAGRNTGNFKLYLSYDYTQFYGKEITLQTPIGQVSQGDTDLYHSHTVLLNADYTQGISGKLYARYGVGAGYSIDSAINPTVEARIGLVWKLGRWTDLYVGYSYRLIQGQIIQGSTKIDEPNQSRIMLSLSHNF